MTEGLKRGGEAPFGARRLPFARNWRGKKRQRAPLAPGEGKASAAKSAGREGAPYPSGIMRALMSRGAALKGAVVAKPSTPVAA